MCTLCVCNCVTLSSTSSNCMTWTLYLPFCSIYGRFHMLSGTTVVISLGPLSFSDPFDLLNLSGICCLLSGCNVIAIGLLMNWFTVVQIERFPFRIDFKDCGIQMWSRLSLFPSHSLVIFWYWLIMNSFDRDTPFFYIFKYYIWKDICLSVCFKKITLHKYILVW